MSSTPGGSSFGPERRIKRRAEFLRVQGIGQRATTPHFVLLVAARDAPSRMEGAPEGEGTERLTATTSSPGCSRLGIVVTKKVGNAVQRNRIKRVCRECFRTWPDLVPDGIDLVIIARSGAAALGLAEVRAEWERAHHALGKRCRAVLAAVEAPARS